MRTNAIHLRFRALPVVLAMSMAALAMVVAPAAEASAPPSPPGCEATKTTVSNTTPLTLTDNGVVTSQLTVPAGVGAFLADIDVFTDLHHTRSRDVDMTLTSPNGKIVTLTTDSGTIFGSTLADVFAGTTWDDDANPGGQVPYSTNNGLTEDHGYQNGIVATPLAPEEPLGALIGFATPVGTWTLTISDDEAGFVGSLDSWSMTLTTYAAAPLTTTPPPLVEDDDVSIVSGGTVSSTISVATPASYLSRASVTTDISHGNSQDIKMTLESPQGTVVTLVSNHGIGDNTFAPTTWLDAVGRDDGTLPYVNSLRQATDHPYELDTGAPNLAPEEGTAAFIGEDPNGTWTLRINDDAAGDEGTLNSWQLQITTPTIAIACTVPPCDGQVVTIAGTEAGQTITGTSGNDVIAGLGGNDTINGGGGNDTICAGDGTDSIDGGPGADAVFGGGGTDVVTYASRTANVAVRLDGAANDGASGEGDNVGIDVENVIGGGGADTLIGSAVANTILGGNGNDLLLGGSAKDRLFGGAGNDTLGGGAGADELSGGTGSDTASFSDHTNAGVTVKIDGIANDGNTLDGPSTTTRDNVKRDIENLTGTIGADNMTGSSVANRIRGLAGSDSFFGLAGNDRLEAKDGIKDRVIDGGTGTDVAIRDAVDPPPRNVP